MTSRTGIVALTLVAAGLVWFVAFRKPTNPSPVQAPSLDENHTQNKRLSVRKAGASTASPEVVPEPEPEPEPVLPPAAPPPPKATRVASIDIEEQPQPSADATASTTPDLPITTVLENTRAAIRSYQSQFKENPVGDNAEISQALNGSNPRQSVFIQPEDGLKLNSLGQMIDNWGTPIFFHSLSRSEMEIRSAGPDRRMWTGDDLVLK